MSAVVAELGLRIDTDWMTPAFVSFRPLTWPPARDWPVSVDRDGKVVSRWGDPVWDLSPLAGTIFKLNFGDGVNHRGQVDALDPANAYLLRLVITWRMWGQRAVRSCASLQVSFTLIRALVSLCSRNGILASELMRFPKVFEQLPDVLPSSRFAKMITELHRLHDARHILGFSLVDLEGLKRLARATPDHEVVQTPYIPPRIWTYQLGRLRECVDDFLSNKAQFEACFRLCLDAYVVNYGSLQAAVERGKDSTRGPFTKNSRTRAGCVYLGPIGQTLDRFGLRPLFDKWLNAREQTLSVGALSSYLSLVNFVSLAYIANFTLQRKEEAASLRTSCLNWEDDEKLGRVPILCGETTKTDSDSDARWVASPSVEAAIQAASAIAHLRMICDSVNPQVAPTDEYIKDPYLSSVPSEPWASGQLTIYHVRRELDSMAEFTTHNPAFFDADQLRITSEDLKVALQLTPNLPAAKFAVGLPWPLAWHQYRRTSAVNMFASGLISDSSMQQQMKHSSRLMPLYYGRGYTRLHLNEKVETTVVAAMYEMMAAQLKTAISDRFVSPHSPDKKQAMAVNILSAKDAKTLTAWARSGKVTFRENRLGGCMKAGACAYGGIESVVRCAGGEDVKACSDVLFDREKASQVQIDLRRTTEEMARLSKDSPRYAALHAEQLAMGNYLNAIKTI